MAIYETFSMRQKSQNDETDDMYVYDKLSSIIRNQICKIMICVLGFPSDEDGNLNIDYDDIRYLEEFHLRIGSRLSEEWGLSFRHHYTFDDILNKFSKDLSTDRSLDFIEMFFSMISTEYSSVGGVTARKTETAIYELNLRLKQHGIGYRFESGQLVKIKSEFLHTNAIKPSIQLLINRKEFKSANREFSEAFEQFRLGKNEDAITNSSKAFESVMKVICNTFKFEHSEKDAGGKLVEALVRNGFVDKAFSAPLINGLLTLRNQRSAHGSGLECREVPDFEAQYALNMAASNIVFLVNAYDDRLRKK